ncbi:unnamed protein product, partial [Polarella glacialis]
GTRLLDLSHNPLEDSGVEAVARHLRHQARLRLRGVNCTHNGLDSLLRRKECIFSLDVGMNPIGVVGVNNMCRAVQGSRQWHGLGISSLQHAGFGGSSLEERAAGLVTPLAQCVRSAHQLRDLDCGGNALGDAGAKRIVEALAESCPHTLERLNLGLSECGIQTANALQAVLSKRAQSLSGGRCPGLQVLDLQGNHLNEDCAAVLAEGLEGVGRGWKGLGGVGRVWKGLEGVGQSYGGGLPLSEFNKLVPPGWRPGIPGYPIKLFFERLKLWYRVTDNAEAQLGILVAGRLQGAPQKIALRLRLPRPVAASGGYDIGDEALIRLSQEQVIDPATNTIVQEYIPSGLQFLCQALRAIYGLQDQDRTTVALDSFYEFKRGHLGLAEFAQEFDHRYESAEDEAGLQMNDTGKTYFFLRGSGLGDKIIEDIKLQMRGDMSRYQEIRTLVLKLARANDKDKETLNMYQDQTDFNYKLNLDETNGNYYGSWHDPTNGEIIEYDYGANTSDDMYYGDYDYVYDGEYSDYDGAGYDEDWYGDDGWQDEVYHGDFPLEEWTWPASAPDSSTVSTAETTLLDVDPSYRKGQTKGKGKGFGAKGKGPSGGSASGIGCATCGSRWHSSLDCPLNDPSKGDQGKGKGGKDYHYENFWKGKGKGKKGGKSKGFGKGWSKGFGKYRPSFGSGKGYGKYSGGYGKSYGKGYGKGKFKGGYGGFRYSSPYNFTAFQDHEVLEAPEHAPTIAFKADGSGTQYYDFDDEKPSSSTRPPPQSTTEPMIDTAGNLGYNDGYRELDTAPAPMPDVRVNSLSFLVGTCSSAFPTDHEDWSSLYHSVRGVKRHGLLIDPGAASGLIGSDTLKEFRDEILLPHGVDIICRPTTQNVSGVSGKPEPALSRVTMPIFPGIKSSTFTADVIGKQGSKCPALLPNPSMRAANMGLLTNFFENGDGMLIVHDNGKRLLYRRLIVHRQAHARRDGSRV